MADHTSECPLCICPVTAETWGVSTPCGHPFHGRCWEKLITGRPADSVPCPICKCVSKGFVQVYLDVGALQQSDGLPSNENTNSFQMSGLRSKSKLINIRSSYFDQVLTWMFRQDNSNHNQSSIQFYNQQLRENIRELKEENRVIRGALWSRTRPIGSTSIDFSMHEGIATYFAALIMTVNILLWLPLRLFFRFITKYSCADSIISMQILLMLPMVYIFEVSLLKVWKRDNVSMCTVKEWFKQLSEDVNNWIWSYIFLLASGTVAIITFKLSSNVYVWFIECTVGLLNGYVLLCMLSYLDYNSKRP